MLTKHLTLNKVRSSQLNIYQLLTTSVINSQKGDIPETSHTMTCGIPRWVTEQERMKVEKKIEQKWELPAHLIRPPCIPGSKPGDYQTCLGGEDQGMYCPPCRLKYKYPSFSENIDFVPPQDLSTCWWMGPNTCHTDENEEALKAFTRECAKDN